MPAGYSLPFRTRNRPSSVSVSVSDTGTGTGGSSGSQWEVKRDQRRRHFASALGTLRRTVFSHDSPGEGYATTSGDVGASENYGLSDFRSIERWRFWTRPFLSTEEKAKISIGMLQVRVVEARGLMVANMGGKSDPYVKLTLTGRYLSHGQEWSEGLRITDQTKYIKNTLDPVWNEDFSLPVRRAGAVLKVEVMDRDFSNADDALGEFEIKIGEELLAQKPTDMWYVLEGSSDMELAAAALAKAKRYGSERIDPVDEDTPSTAPTGSADLLEQIVQDNEGKGSAGVEQRERHQGGEDDTRSGVEGTAVVGEEDGTAQVLDSSLPFQSTPEGRLGSYTSMFKPSIRSKASVEQGNSGSFPPSHSHELDEDDRSCEASIELRRRAFGEVRLQLRFEFDDFAETCSHLWPEEPRTSPPGPPFSPNRVYLKAMLLLELARPYLGFMLEANAVVTWVRPLKSFFWLVVLAFMLIFPAVLIVTFNGIVMLVTLSGYLNQTLGDVDEEDSADTRAGRFEGSATQGGPVGLSISRSYSSATGGSESFKKYSAKLFASRPDVLDPAYAAGDAEMEEIYRKVEEAKKLPRVVEEVGKRIFSANGSVVQQQVEQMTVTLMKTRRIFRPIDRRGLLRMIMYFTVNALLELWLYLSGRFNLYLLLLCLGLFSYHFYYRRGKALIMAVREASRSRRARRAYSAVDNPPPTSSSSSGEAETAISDGSKKSFVLGVAQTRHPAFAPPGATLVKDASLPSTTEARSSDLPHHPSGSRATPSFNVRTVGTGLFRKSLLPRGEWFTSSERTREPDVLAISRFPVVEEDERTSRLFPTPTEASNKGDLSAEDVLLLGAAGEGTGGPYTGRDHLTLFNTNQYGSVQEQQVRSLRVPRWRTPWRRAGGENAEVENIDLVENQGSTETSSAWTRRITKWTLG